MAWGEGSILKTSKAARNRSRADAPASLLFALNFHLLRRAALRLAPWVAVEEQVVHSQMRGGPRG